MADPLANGPEDEKEIARSEKEEALKEQEKAPVAVQASCVGAMFLLWCVRPHPVYLYSTDKDCILCYSL